ncbi:MAG: vitamin K epoxide reductase family protein [Candidatus Micrarchaeota archaeon]|nr:vitamin K epoxide reductase family protein [Candidatus Micrarchaeota archaeon]
MQKRDNIFWLEAALAAIGLIISAYLTVYHYFGLPLSCPATQVIDCGIVLSSKFATIPFGIPVSVLGVVWCAIFLYLLTFKDKEYKLYWNVVGFFSLFYFWFAEYSLGKICLYCTAVHAIVVALLLLVIWQYFKK